MSFTTPLRILFEKAFFCFLKLPNLTIFREFRVDEMFQGKYQCLMVERKATRYMKGRGNKLEIWEGIYIVDHFLNLEFLPDLYIFTIKTK